MCTLSVLFGNSDMGLISRLGKVHLAVLIFMAISPAMAEKKIGQITKDSDPGYVIREKVQKDIGFPEDIELGDALGVFESGDELRISFENTYNTSQEARGEDQKKRTEVTVNYGVVKLASSDKGVMEFECVLDRGSSAIFEHPPHTCRPVVPDASNVSAEGTRYQVDVMARDTRISVYEGVVSITSTNANYPEPRHVHAGEWVRFRKGEPIPKPKKFTMAIGPGAGSTECIYSDCKLVDSVLIPSRPVVTPGELIPPPPNPPGQR